MGPTLLLLVACERSAPSRPARRDASTVVAARDVPAPAARVRDAGASPGLRESDVWPLTGAGPRAIEAGCDDARVAVHWRVGPAAGWATHALREGASWRGGTYPPRGIGGVLAHDGAVLGVTLTRELQLALHDLADGRELARAALAPLRLRELSTPHLLAARGGRALVVLQGRVSGAERAVWLVAFGAGAVSIAVAAQGALGAVVPGARALITSVARQADGVTRLRGRWLDTSAAMREMSSGRVTLGGAWRSDASIILPHRGIAFAPTSSATGAVLYQGVLGAERGAAGVARFSPDGAAEDHFLGLIPTALLAATDDPPGVTAWGWDERYRPRRWRIGPGASVTPTPPGEVTGDALTTLVVARETRLLECDRVRYQLRIDPAGLRIARIEADAQRRESTPSR